MPSRPAVLPALLGACLAASALVVAGPAAGQHATQPARQQAGATADWRSMTSQWPKRQGVAVSDVVAFGRTAFAVGTSSKGKAHTPWVQVCKGRSCKASRLPRPGKRSAVVTSVSGSGPTDLWAVGWRIDPRSQEHRPVFWHRKGAAWKIFNAGFDLNHNIVLTTVEVANKSKAFALGRYRYGARKDQVTSTLYRWNGKGWKEVADLDHRDVFGKPCAGWYNRDFVDVVARPGSAIVFGRCGTRHRLAVMEQGDTTWTQVVGSRLPDDVVWRVGAMVGQQVWLMGAKRGGKRVIVANDGGRWKRVTAKGIRPNATVNDLAGVYASKVTAVGWVKTGGRHHIARAWRWGAGSWHETKVPAGISRSGLSAAAVDGNGPVFAIGQDLGRRPPQRAIIVHSVG